MPISHGRAPSSSSRSTACRRRTGLDRRSAPPDSPGVLMPLQPLGAGLVGKALDLPRSVRSRSTAAPSPRMPATRATGPPRSGCSPERLRAASSPSRVRRNSTSPMLRACSWRAASATSASRSGRPGDDRLGQLAALSRQREHLVGGIPVARGQRGVGLLGHALDARQLIDGDRLSERDLVRAAGGVAGVALDDPIDGHLRHPPPGGELAAGDRDHPDEVSYSSALREMSTDFFGSPVEISGRTPA